MDIFIFVLFLFLLGYLFCIQVLDTSGYRKKGIAIRSSSTLSLRGDILDRSGLKLATDELIYEIYAHPSLYSSKRSIAELAGILAPYLNIPEQEISKKLLSNKVNIITLKKNVDRETANKIKKLNLREISVGTLKRRFYPQDSIGSHIIGYYSHLSENAVGIEYTKNNILNNVINTTNFQKTSTGEIIFDMNTDLKDLTEMQKGEDVQLTIDTTLQFICERELQKRIKESKAQRGAVIVSDVKNGEILAYASYPGFNPNQYSKASQEAMKNWSLTDIYPPGSTFKIITVAIAMELGKINEYSRILDTGKLKIDGYTITNHDYRENPYPGNISLEYLFEHSSNVGSANIALMLPPGQYYDKLKLFGFGQKTGIDLTAESMGLLPKPNNWYKSRQASMGYGYGASVTAIQMLSAISAIANNGVWITPHVVKYSQEDLINHVQTRRIMSEENAKNVTRILTKSIENGNSILKLEKYSVAAKTGTSRKPSSNGKSFTNDVFTSTVGYLPASNPQIAIYVVIDSPRTNNDWGSTIAAPLFKEIALETVKLLNIQADKGKSNGKY